MTGLFWLAISTVGLIFSLVVTHWIHSQYQLGIRVDPAQKPEGPLPKVSVIIPARNEARNIASCIQGLLAQTYPNYQVIVVDDRSTDETPRILAGLAADRPAGQIPQLIILKGESLPDGWAGKPHALYQGAQAADGEWLCFIDADTFACPEMFMSTIAAAQASKADLFTMLTDQKLVSFWEKVILPLVFTALSVGFSPRRVNDPNRPDAIANGQFLLFRREAYVAIGGHQAVADSIVEDRDLARRIKAAGFRLVVADGRSVATTRMYTTFPEIWEGWTKNIYLGLSDQPGLALLGIFGAFISLLGALGFIAWITASIVWLARGGVLFAGVSLAEALAAFSVLTIVRGEAAKSFDISPWYGLTFPLGALIFATMMIASTFNVLSGQGITWKGRRYLNKRRSTGSM